MQPIDRPSRDIPRDQLRPDQCQWQTAYGMPGSTYCGAPKRPDAAWCDYHAEETQ